MTLASIGYSRLVQKGVSGILKQVHRVKQIPPINLFAPNATKKKLIKKKTQ